jgi:hypothetical protein
VTPNKSINVSIYAQKNHETHENFVDFSMNFTWLINAGVKLRRTLSKCEKQANTDTTGGYTDAQGKSPREVYYHAVAAKYLQMVERVRKRWDHMI